MLIFSIKGFLSILLNRKFVLFNGKSYTFNGKFVLFNGKSYTFNRKDLQKYFRFNQKNFPLSKKSNFLRNSEKTYKK